MKLRTDVSLTEYCNYDHMLNRILLIAIIGICAAVTPVHAGSEIDEFLAAVRQGKYVCLTLDPSIGCHAISRYKQDGSKMRDWSEFIVAVDPPVVALLSTSQSLPDAENCWMTADTKILEGPTFYRSGQLLSEIERVMFEDNFNNMLQKKIAGGAKVCAIFSDGPKGRMVAYSYDGKVPEDPPLYFSFHTREDLPPLALGVKSLLLAK